MLKLKMSDAEKKRLYIQILKIAKASENQAIKIPMIALVLAPLEDQAQLAEILNDENDHDAIYTDLLFKAVTGNPQGAQNTEFYPVDALPQELKPEIEEQHLEWKEVKHLTKSIKKSLAAGDVPAATEANKKLNELLDYMTMDALQSVIDAIEITEDGGPGSGNFGHYGRPGKHGGSTSRKELARKKKRKSRS